MALNGQVTGDIDEQRGNNAVMHRARHLQEQYRLVRGLVFGGLGPCRSKGAFEVGELFEGRVEVGHIIQNGMKFYGRI